MSAFIVNHRHIDAMVILSLQGASDGQGRWNPLAPQYGGADALGQMLVNENTASVNHRYHDDDTPADYRYNGFGWGHAPTAVEGLKLIGCYQYQACEHPGWHQSTAKDFCNSLRDALIRELPGYDDAPYEWVA